MSGYVPNPPKDYKYSGGTPVDTYAQRWAEYKALVPNPEDKPKTKGCVFAKSCNLPDGVIDHEQSSGFIPVESLTDYGLWAVLGTGIALTSQVNPLQRVGRSPTGFAIAQRLGGSLSLSLLEGAGTVEQPLNKFRGLYVFVHRRFFS